MSCIPLCLSVGVVASLTEYHSVFAVRQKQSESQTLIADNHAIHRSTAWGRLQMESTMAVPGDGQRYVGKSMVRDDLKTLYHDLREARFDFVPRGEHNIREIYAFVQDRFPNLCDDSYLCSENCKSGYNSPEWKHKVRTALWDLRRHANDVRTGSERGLWIFGESHNDRMLQLIANDLDPPSPDRVETTTFRILRDTALARQIKAVHQHQCQICGLAIELPDGARYAEAHHIQPLGAPHDGPDIAPNIIVLCPNHHAMCDYGVIPLDLEQLRLHPEHEIGSEFIDYHNAMVHVAQTPT